MTAWHRPEAQASRPDMRTVFKFSRFAFFPERRLLLADGQPVKLGGRALDLLCVLIEERHKTVSKDELLDRVWPDMHVEEANLPVQVMALRQALGKEAISTVPGRGYRFVLPLTEGETGSGPSNDSTAPGKPWPSRVTWVEPLEPLIGRSAELTALRHLVVERRLVTLLGTAGVGKSRLSQAVGAELRHAFEEGVWWIELAPLTEAERVPDAVAQALGLSLPGLDDPALEVSAPLRDSRLLLVLDNAEHVLAGVRRLLSTLMQRAPQVHVLVTSQAVLHLPCEHRYALSPLSLPERPDLTSCRHSDAVALFTARASAADRGFKLDDGSAKAVADICARLDGIPLALELAAARLPLLGLEGLRQRLDERFQLLTAGSATHLPRHQTLKAALAWSYGLLELDAQRVFRRIGIFVGGFTLETAQQVAADESLGPWQVVEHLATLVDRSLVQAQLGASPRYRLLESARLFAGDELSASGEAEVLRERHARALNAQLSVRRDDHRLWRTPPAPVEVLRAELDNVRAAMDWAATSGDATLAINLAIGASHAFLAAGLNAEYLDRVLPLTARVPTDAPDAQIGRFWSRIALAASRNGHPSGLQAAWQAIRLWRRLGDEGRLYDALTWAIAIAARTGQGESIGALVEEGERIERAHWPAAYRSSFRWAKYRWWQSQGQAMNALACAREQADLLGQAGSWAMHVAWGANIADCEIAMGRPAEAERVARAALQALDELGIDENLVGHVIDALVLALVQLGRAEEALPLARRALRLLAREGDDLRLLEPLALAAAAQGDWHTAARLTGHADAGLAQRGESRWPSTAQRRAELQARLEQVFAPDQLRELMRSGAALSREEIFAVAFDRLTPPSGHQAHLAPSASALAP